MRYLELTDKEFDKTIKQIDSILSKHKDIESQTYMTKRLLSNNDKWLIIEPKEVNLKKALSDFDWQDKLPILKDFE